MCVWGDATKRVDLATRKQGRPKPVHGREWHTVAGVGIDRRDGALSGHTAGRGSLTIALAEGLDPGLVARDEAVSLLASEPAIVKAIEVPALEPTPKNGSDGVQGRADQIDRLVVRESVQRGRVGEVLEDAIIVVMTRRQVAARASVGESRAVARRAEERLLPHEPKPALVSLAIHQLQVSEPLKQKGGPDAAHGRDGVGAIVLARKRLDAEAIYRHGAPWEVLAAHGRTAVLLRWLAMTAARRLRKVKHSHE